MLRLLPDPRLVHPAPNRPGGGEVAILLDLVEDRRNGPAGLEAVDRRLVSVEYLVEDVGHIGLSVTKLGGHLVDIKAIVDAIAARVVRTFATIASIVASIVSTSAATSVLSILIAASPAM